MKTVGGNHADGGSFWFEDASLSGSAAIETVVFSRLVTKDNIPIRLLHEATASSESPKVGQTRRFRDDGKSCLPSHAAKLANLIGLNIYGTDHRSPASLIRVKIGHMCIGASGECPHQIVGSEC